MATSIRRGMLAKTWVHSHEEDAGGAHVYRPETHPFPPARGRDALALNADGSLQRSIPGPDDRRGGRLDGTWSVDGTKLTLQQPGAASREYDIESVTPDKLLLRPL